MNQNNDIMKGKHKTQRNQEQPDAALAQKLYDKKFETIINNNELPNICKHCPYPFSCEETRSCTQLPFMCSYRIPCDKCTRRDCELPDQPIL